jgi:four helix bundle protein
MFGFQKLDVYRAAIAFLGESDLLAAACKGRAALGEQLRRAALSIPLNIAEGTGKFGPDSRRFYAIARGSALECAAIIDSMEVLRLGIPADLAQGRDLLDRIVAMLTVLIRARSNAANANPNANATGYEDACGSADETASASASASSSGSGSGDSPT